MALKFPIRNNCCYLQPNPTHLVFPRRIELQAKAILQKSRLDFCSKNRAIFDGKHSVFTSSYEMFTSWMRIPHPSIHATQSKLTTGFAQPDLIYVKSTAVVKTADASSPIDSNLKCLHSHNVDFHQINHSHSSKLVLIFLDPSRQTIQPPIANGMDWFSPARRLASFIWKSTMSYHTTKFQQTSAASLQEDVPLQKAALTTQRTLQQQKKNWWPLRTASRWANFLDTSRYVESSTPLVHHILVASVSVSFVASITLYTPSLDLKPSHMVLSAPCGATLKNYERTTNHDCIVFALQHRIPDP